MASSSDGSTPHGIEPISPSSAYGQYLDSIEDEKASGTVDSHRSRLKFFVRWCGKQDDIEVMSDIRPSHIDEWKTWRRKTGPLKRITLKTHLDTLRVFVRWSARNDYVFDGLIDAVPHLSVSREEQVDETWLPPERGNQIKEYVRKYASVEKRAIFELFWSTGLRLCSVHSLDVDDFDHEDRYISLEHRPNEGTTLKNGQTSERTVALPKPVAEAVQDWIQSPDRPKVTDDHGRNPVFTTRYGRRGKNGLREIIYSLTEPCTIGAECPAGKDPETCAWAVNQNKASKCPESVSPHSLRKGAATRLLGKGIDDSKISARMDASEEVIWHWYSRLKKKEEMETRRDEFDSEYV